MPLPSPLSLSSQAGSLESPSWGVSAKNQTLVCGGKIVKTMVTYQKWWVNFVDSTEWQYIYGTYLAREQKYDR